MCTAHPKKGDLKAHEGLSAEEEEHQEQCAKAHLGAILFADSTKHKFFSKELLHLADPHFVPSPPESPAWNRQKKKPTKTQPRRQAAQPRASSEMEEDEDEEEEEVSRDLKDMATFWEDEED